MGPTPRGGGGGGGGGPPPGPAGDQDLVIWILYE
jgi:hypothetical protein